MNVVTEALEKVNSLAPLLQPISFIFVNSQLITYSNFTGGAKGSAFFTKRYATGSGLNSMNLDFLPVRNIEEEIEVAVGGIMGAVPVGKYNSI